MDRAACSVTLTANCATLCRATSTQTPQILKWQLTNLFSFCESAFHYKYLIFCPKPKTESVFNIDN